MKPVKAWAILRNEGVALRIRRPFIEKQGYVLIPQNGNSRREHVVIAELAIGKPLPALAQVHHHDGNRSNNANSNLVICEDNAYHALLHFRQRVLGLGGNPDNEKPCSGPCKRMMPLSEFHRYRGHVSGYAAKCRECVHDYDISRRRLRVS